jgi:hypothetical protein
LFGNQ